MPLRTPRALLLAGAALLTLPAAAGAAEREQTTSLISHARDGGMPNGASSHAVISNDKRYARVIAYESDASNLVARDTNGAKDVFAVMRSGRIGNDGAPWQT